MGKADKKEKIKKKDKNHKIKKKEKKKKSMKKTEKQENHFQHFNEQQINNDTSNVSNVATIENSKIEKQEQLINNNNNLNINQENVKNLSEQSIKQENNIQNIDNDNSIEFYQCECGALVEITERKCWCCNRSIPSKKENISKSQTISSTDSASLELLHRVQYTRFITCNKCGANNEIVSSLTKCWACGNQMDTSEIFKAMAFASEDEIVTEKTTEGEIKRFSKKSTRKKENISYVLHCSKCNAWFVSLDYTSKMICPYCKTQKKVFVSYSCPSCKKLFDLNKIIEQKCPSCGNMLEPTKEEMLY
ncbi:MAG: hypothetical protein ACTSRZ_09600 [Promethearchaeota archaeon]